MASRSDSQLVLVTGATGFIAPHIIQLLLEDGYRVRGTVRDLQDEKKIKPVKELFPDETKFTLVQADLNQDEGWKEALKECSFVMHVASPFPAVIPSNEDELIKPAVEGTKRVLTAAADAGTVKRVILTSSITAIHGELAFEEGKMYTEEDWSNLESPNFDGYSKSKTLAEKAAWDFVKELPEERRFDLVVVNPSLVLGPVLTNSLTTSLDVIKRLMERSIPMLARLSFTICDVRDVALAHMKALTLGEAAGKRYIVATQNLWFKDIAVILSKEFKSQGYSVPTLIAPYMAVWLNSCFDKTLKIILGRIGHEVKYDNTRMKEGLGLNPEDINKTILDTAYSLIEKGFVKKTKKYKQGKKDAEQTEKVNGEVEETEEKKEEEHVEKEPKMQELEPEDKEKPLLEGATPQAIAVVE